MLRNRGHVLRIFAPVKNPSMHHRMQRLYAPPKHLREARQFAHIAYRQARIAQHVRRSTGRDQLHTQTTQSLRKLHQPRLIGHRQQGTTHRLQITHAMSDSMRNMPFTALDRRELASGEAQAFP